MRSGCVGKTKGNTRVYRKSKGLDIISEFGKHISNASPTRSQWIRCPSSEMRVLFPQSTIPVQVHGHLRTHDPRGAHLASRVGFPSIRKRRSPSSCWSGRQEMITRAWQSPELAINLRTPFHFVYFGLARVILEIEDSSFA